VNIGKVSRLTGLTCQTIRHYERIDLVVPLRSSNGYRIYKNQQVTELLFLKNARKHFFSTEECRELLDIYRSDSDKHLNIKDILRQKLRMLEYGLNSLMESQSFLQNLLSESIDEMDGTNDLISRMLVNSGCSYLENTCTLRHEIVKRYYDKKPNAERNTRH